MYYAYKCTYFSCLVLGLTGDEIALALSDSEIGEDSDLEIQNVPDEPVREFSESSESATSSDSLSDNDTLLSEFSAFRGSVIFCLLYFLFTSSKEVKNLFIINTLFHCKITLFYFD